MKKVIVLSMLLVLAGSVHAATLQWANFAGGTTDWYAPGNWNASAGPPTSSSDVVLYAGSGAMPTGPVINGGNAVANSVLIANNNALVGGQQAIQTLTIDPGSTLAVNTFIYVGGNGATKRWGAFYVNGGDTTCGSFSVGRSASGQTGDQEGWLYMTGGTITVSGLFSIAEYPNSSGFVHLDGGTITTGTFAMLNNGGTGTSRLDITDGGRLIIDSSYDVASEVASGWITANGNANDVRYSFDGTQTTVWAVPVPEPSTLCLLGLGALSLLRRK